MLDKFLINEGASIKEAMKKMNDTGSKALFILSKENKLFGSLTDGDIRRWILKKGSLNEKIEKACNKNPVFVNQDYDLEEVKKIMLKLKIEWIPVIKEGKEISEILLLEDILEHDQQIPKEKLDLPVIIMAGGKGTRLDPFTKILPKPLIPIGDRAIIDIIMEKFSIFGVNEFYISINHKAKMVKSYFEEMNTKYLIHYIEEDMPLGTAGCLKFLQDKIKDSIMVSNCDIIIDCDYSEFAAFHHKNNYDISIVGSFRHFTIPYGICEIEDGGVLKNITEKPEYDFLVNTGMYTLSKKALNLIPKNQKTHITDLIELVKNAGGKVGVYPINEKAWIDIGQWDEYHKSVKLLKLNK